MFESVGKNPGALETEVHPRKNEVRWNGQTLRVPWLGINLPFLDVSSGGNQVRAVDPNDQVWIEIGTYNSLHRAKARVRMELSRDSERHQGGTNEVREIVITADELYQVIKYGSCLPQSPEECAKDGNTHVAFGPAFQERHDYELQPEKNAIGVWRPMVEEDWDKRLRHDVEAEMRSVDRIIAGEKIEELRKK